MRRRDVVGRRIVEIRQERFWNSHLQRVEVALSALYLDNGTCISFGAIETEEMPIVEGRIVSLKPPTQKASTP